MTPRIVWFDCMAADLDAAREALAEHLGWTFPQAAGPTVALAGGQAVAGLIPIPAEAESRPHWVAHAAVEDVATTCGRLAFLRGEVLIEPSPGQGAEITALVVDPAGATLAPFQPDQPLPAPSGAPGRVGFATLLASRREVGVRAYRTLLGWTAGDDVPTGAGPLTLLRADEAVVAGVLALPSELEPQWVPHVRVADLPAALEGVVDAGGEVVIPPTEVPGVGTIALAALADGLPVGLLQG